MVSAQLPKSESTRGWRNKHRRRRVLIDAAANVFAERGYEAATLREIANAADCSMALVTRYFEGKRGLLLAVIEERVHEAEKTLKTRGAGESRLDEDILDAVLWAVELRQQTHGISRVVWGQVILDPELGKTIGQEMVSRSIKAYQILLLRHREQGHIRSDVSVEEVAHVIQGMTHHLGFLCLVVWGLDTEYVRRLARQFVMALCEGISSDETVSATSKPVSRINRTETIEEEELLEVYRNGAPGVRQVLDGAIKLARDGQRPVAVTAAGQKIS